MTALNHFTFTIANPDHDTLTKLNAFKHHPSTANLKCKLQINAHGKLYITGELSTPFTPYTVREALKIPRLYLKPVKSTIKPIKRNNNLTTPTPATSNPLLTWLKSFPSAKSILSHAIKSITDHAPPPASNPSE
jgi:hypothetical protein